MSDQRSPWVWIGCGCGILAVLGIVAIGGATWFGVKTVKDLGDPEKMHARGTSLLGAERLPDGYEVELALDLPMSIEMVSLRGGSGREFVYVRGVGSSKRLPDFVEGTIGLADLFEDAGVNLSDGEIIGEGRAEFAPLAADWIVYRGEVQLDDRQGHAQGSFDLGDHDDAGLVAVALLRCPEDRKIRLGIWRGPDPDPEIVSSRLDLTGTTGDPAAIREMLSGFRVCG